MIWEWFAIAGSGQHEPSNMTMSQNIQANRPRTGGEQRSRKFRSPSVGWLETGNSSNIFSPVQWYRNVMKVTSHFDSYNYMIQKNKNRYRED